MTNAERLGEGLKNFDYKEDFIQEDIAESIACPRPGGDLCDYDIKAGTRDCARCKIKWLLSEWEG